jgi:hypothetical protein
MTVSSLFRVVGPSRSNLVSSRITIVSVTTGFWVEEDTTRAFLGRYDVATTP